MHNRDKQLGQIASRRVGLDRVPMSLATDRVLTLSSILCQPRGARSKAALPHFSQNH